MQFMDPRRKRLSLRGSGVFGAQATQNHFVFLAQVLQLVEQAQFVSLFEGEGDARGHDQDLHASTHD